MRIPQAAGSPALSERVRACLLDRFAVRATGAARSTRKRGRRG